MNGKSKTLAFEVFTEFQLLTTNINNGETLKCIPLKGRTEKIERKRGAREEEKRFSMK